MSRRWLKSLRFRLALTTAAILLVSLGAAALLMSRATRREFHRLEEERFIRGPKPAPARPQTALLESFFAASGDWRGVQPLLDRMTSAVGVDVALADVSGHVVALSGRLAAGSATLSDRLLRVTWKEASGGTRELRVLSPAGIPLTSRGNGSLGSEGRVIGTLFVLPRPTTHRSDEEIAFVGSLDRWLIGAVALAGLLALVLLAAVTRRILGPVEELTRAASRLRAGELGPRVAVRSDDEIGELGRAFNEMADGLEQNERLRRNLVTDVAHELRTPLTSMRCQLEAVQDGLAAAGPTLVASLHEETLLLARLVDDLQDLAQADAGALRLDLVSVSPIEACSLALDAIRTRAEAAGVTLGCDVQVGFPPVSADPQRLGQVLRNLLENAIRHTPEGGSVRLTAREKEGGLVELEVRDTGEGISAQHLPHVFERLYRADPSRVRDTGGAGLGLAIARSLVTLQGGSIRVESTPGNGSAFAFTLPKFPSPSSSVRHTAA